MCGSKDPDPSQNITDPEHCFEHCVLFRDTVFEQLDIKKCLIQNHQLYCDYHDFCFRTRTNSGWRRPNTRRKDCESWTSWDPEGTSSKFSHLLHVLHAMSQLLGVPSFVTKTLFAYNPERTCFFLQLSVPLTSNYLNPVLSYQEM